MILLNEIVQVFHWPQLAASGQCALPFELVHSLRVRRVAVDIDNTWRYCVPGMQSFAKETLGCLCVASGAEHELDGVPVRVYRSIQIHPPTFTLM
jgi:hypothetical protein